MTFLVFCSSTFVYADEQEQLNLRLVEASKDGRLEVVKDAIASGADIETQTKDGSTPLNLASQKGYTEIVKLLLESNADVNIAHTSDSTPLYIASQNGHSQIIKLLEDYGAKE